MARLIKVPRSRVIPDKPSVEVQPVDASGLRRHARKQKAEVDAKRDRKRKIPSQTIQPRETVPEPTDGTELKRADAESKSKENVVLIGPEESLKLGTQSKTNDFSGSLCSECGKRFRVLAIYRETNQGEVRLCPKCEAEALDRSFGQDDAMEHTGIRGGPAAANRPKIRIRPTKADTEK